MKIRYYVIAWSDVEKRTLCQPCHTLREARALWGSIPKTIARVVTSTR